MVSIVLFSVLVSLSVLLGMAFFTLIERKYLGYVQLRKGPNKVGIIGLPQPIADAVKLFSKEQPTPNKANVWVFLLSPVLSLSLALMMWSLYPCSSMVAFFMFSLVFFLCVSSLNVYVVFGAGWGSNSKYALLGALRGVAQTVSYEVSMALILFSVLVMVSSFNLFFIKTNQVILVMSLMMPLSVLWFVTCLAETNRSPFDFAEGESELVSGFNVEYGSGGFALIFMAEYLNIIGMSMVTSVLLFFTVKMVFISDFMLLVEIIMVSVVFIWVRGTMPRMRYDMLMSLTWKVFLPFSVGILLTMFLLVRIV